MADGLTLALDQGTTSSRALVVDSRGNVLSSSKHEFGQIFPSPGRVEHKPLEIWESQLRAAKDALSAAGLKASQIAAAGITNQRETVVFWDSSDGSPVCNAIVWQCRRAAGVCAEMRKSGAEPFIREKTGLVLDPYFSAAKIKWAMDNTPAVRETLRAGRLMIGTVDSWLLYKLTGRHLTDPSNASRTMLFDISGMRWDDDLLKLFGVPREILPDIAPSSGFFGNIPSDILGAEIPVFGVAGDQQAALFGQACFEPGEVKSTYGTGCFTLVNTGAEPFFGDDGLLATVAWDLGRGPVYALEGSVFTAGAVVQWLRDQLGVIDSAPESETLARSVPDSGGVYLVPAFTGLGAPHWDPDARGAVFGLTRGSSRAHLVRAALESVAFQAHELLEAFKKRLGRPLELIKVDGGASLNSFLMEFQADIAGLPVMRAASEETTALGAACLAGLGRGILGSTDEIRAAWRPGGGWRPSMPAEKRAALLRGWSAAVAAARSFKNNEQAGAEHGITK
jgi:glycerol kinase